MRQNRFVPSLLGILLLFVGLRPVFAVPPFGIYGDASFSPTVTVTESNEDRVRLQFDMEHLPQGFTVNFSSRLPGLWENMNTEAGSPHYLPRFTILVALPNTGNPTVVIESWNDSTMNAIPTGSLQENFAGQPQAWIGEVGILGGVRVAPLTIKPIAYTSNASTCDVMRTATISIEIDDQTGDNPVTAPRTSFSRPWQQVFEATVINWEYIPNIGVGAESHMLIIVPNTYFDNGSLTNYIRWKEQRGMKITVVLKNSIGGNPNASQIRNRIITEVAASNPRIDYVTLVGDETQLAAYMQATTDPITRFSDVSHPELSPFTSHGYFSEIEGTDVFPDVFVGQWVVNSNTEVSNVGARTILHERNPFDVDSLRFERVVVSADNSEISQRATKRYVARELDSFGFTEVDSIWAGADGAQAMIDEVSQGETFVNYRGSGWSFGWAGIQFYVWSIPQLNNTRKLPIVTGIGCGVARFQDADCFGEAWMLAGSPQNPKGSVGFIGPAFNTHTVYNDCLDSLLYKAMLTYGISNLQPALVAGKMMTWALMGDFLDENDLVEIMKTMFRQYLVLSDPSLQMYTDTPVRAQLVAPAAVAAGEIQFDVGVGNLSQIDADSLQITAWLGDGSFVTSWIEQGEPGVTLSLNTMGLDSLIISVTGDGAVTGYQTVTVGPEGPFIFHCEATLDDAEGGNGDSEVNPGETIRWHETLWNVGTEDAIHVVATLSSTAPAVTIMTPTLTVGDVDSGEALTTDEYFVFTVADNAPANEALDFTITFTMDNAEPQAWPVILSNHAPLIELDGATVADDNNNFWDRGESIGLAIALTNDGNDDLLSTTCELSCDDPLVTVVDGEATIPGIAEEESYTTPADAFVLIASWATPAGHPVMLNLVITADMGTYTYTRTMPIPFVIGEVTSVDPFADGAMHYWMYDNTDANYTEVPTFEWVEIAIDAGGPGDQIPFTLGNQTLMFEVPFEYNYYGQTFDSLSISNDGWVLPGRTSATSANNQLLPAPADNANGMIAPLWLNLWRTVGETGQVCYFYDPAADRFIVEWYQLHDQTGQFQETFQLQLLNPATYPTESGDAEWIFLYQEVSARATSAQGATIGLENPAETIGMTYVYHGNYTSGAATLQSGRAIKITTEPPVILSTEPVQVALPTAIELAQNFPNPFNPETTIEFALPRNDVVSLSVFDVLGRKVATLVDGALAAGTHHVLWRGQLQNGSPAASGIYFYRLETSQSVVTRKMVLLK